MKDVLLDYDTPWNKVHWRSMVASYTASPFFELMMDELKPFYSGKIKYLIDLNMGLLKTTLGLLGVHTSVKTTETFIPIAENEDPREVIHPKLDLSEVDPGFLPVAYHQVFSDRHGFIPNLSVLDLLFNEGPHASGILQKSLKT
jgi:hypothetical protein